MEKTLHMSLLFDFYGSLLTDRQQDIFKMYFHEDLSFGEIGEQLDVSRQAIYDIVKRSGDSFAAFETKLGLLAKHQEQQDFYNEMLRLIAMIRKADEDWLTNLTELENKIRQAQVTS